MPAIHVSGVDRPRLAPLLAARGLRVASDAQEAVARLACAPGQVPTLVEAADAGEAAALLDAGADDVVLVRDPDALVAARLAALVRRTDVVCVGPLTIDTAVRIARRDGRALLLRPKEYALLLHLARHAGEVVDRAELRRVVLGLGFDPGTNGLAVHVSRLRAELDRGHAPMLATEPGTGYRLAVPEE